MLNSLHLPCVHSQLDQGILSKDYTSVEKGGKGEMFLIENQPSRPMYQTWFGGGKGPKRVVGFGRSTKAYGKFQKEK